MTIITHFLDHMFPEKVSIAEMGITSPFTQQLWSKPLEAILVLFFHYASHQSVSKTSGISLQNNPNATSSSFHCCHQRSIHHHLLSSFSIASQLFSMLLSFLCYQKDSQSPPMNFHITQSKSASSSKSP